MNKKQWRVGIDLGGTKIEGVLLDQSGCIRQRRRVATVQSAGYDAILRKIRSLYRSLERHAPVGVTLGIGTPGAISRDTGLMKNSNTQCLNRRPLKDDLLRLLKRPFMLENDANCFALAEAKMGAGRKRRLVFGVIMGTGCGGGLIMNGKLWAGPQHIAGEWGHMAVDPRGPVCYCGSRGCVETLISGGGLEALYRARFGRREKLERIEARALAGDKELQRFFQRFYRSFGRAMANLIHILDPDIVVLGGGLSKMESLYTEGVREVRRCIFSDSLRTPIVRNQLGDSAGVLGAALIGV